MSDNRTIPPITQPIAKVPLVQITIPDIPRVRAKAVESGFATVEDYVIHLVTRDVGLTEDFAAAAPPDSADQPEPRTAFDAFDAAGVIGCVDGGPDDMATNPSHMERFGRDS